MPRTVFSCHILFYFYFILPFYSFILCSRNMFYSIYHYITSLKPVVYQVSCFHVAVILIVVYYALFLFL